MGFINLIVGTKWILTHSTEMYSNLVLRSLNDWDIWCLKANAAWLTVHFCMWSFLQAVLKVDILAASAEIAHCFHQKQSHTYLQMCSIAPYSPDVWHGAQLT